MTETRLGVPPEAGLFLSPSKARRSPIAPRGADAAHAGANIVGGEDLAQLQRSLAERTVIGVASLTLSRMVCDPSRGEGGSCTNSTPPAHPRHWGAPLRRHGLPSPNGSPPNTARSPAWPADLLDRCGELTVAINAVQAELAAIVRGSPQTRHWPVNNRNQTRGSVRAQPGRSLSGSAAAGPFPSAAAPGCP